MPTDTGDHSRLEQQLRDLIARHRPTPGARAEAGSHVEVLYPRPDLE